jgi:hypothetical protein
MPRGGNRIVGDRRTWLRAIYRRRAQQFYTRHAVWVVQRMAIARVEREWRMQLIVGPDTRSLTGRLLGDPKFERSALYAKRMGWI